MSSELVIEMKTKFQNYAPFGILYLLPYWISLDSLMNLISVLSLPVCAILMMMMMHLSIYLFVGLYSIN